MHVSLFRAVEGTHQQHRLIQTVPIMRAISYLIEDQLLLLGQPVELYAGFQRFSRFALQAERYAQLARVCRRIYVFGVPDVEPPTIPGIEFIPLAEDAALALEWFILVDTPDFWTTLVTREVVGADLITGGRRYDGVWSFEHEAVDRVSLLISQLLGHTFRPNVHRNYSHQSAHVSAVNGRLLQRLETTRLSERRRWGHIVALQRLSEVLAHHRPPVYVNGAPLYLLRDTAQVLARLHGVERAAVAFRPVDQREYTVLNVSDADAVDVQTQGLAGPSARAMAEAAPILVSDARRARERDSLLPSAPALLSVPIVSRGASYGVVTLGGVAANTFDDDDVQVVQMLCAMLSEALDREQVGAEQAGERMRRLEQALVRLRAPVGRLLSLHGQMRAAGPLSPEQEELMSTIEQGLGQMGQALGGTGAIGAGRIAITS
jgi:hypothetical protein